jgi:putative membrane protein
MKIIIQNSLRGAAFLLAASLAATLAAQTTDTSTSPSAPAAATMPDNSKLAHHDKAFLRKAAEGGMKEVAVSQAVVGRLTNPQVRDFANMMVTDHTAANSELMSLAVAKGLTLPAADPKITDKWSEKSGELDKKYLHEMVEDHEDAVKLFEKASKSDDADIAAFAQKTLPTLMHHLEMAKDLKKTL